MDRELEDYFDNFNMLFAQKGYKQLCEEIEGNIERLSDISTVKDEQELFFRQGQIAAYRTILNFQGTVEAAREQAEDVQDI